MFIKNNNTNLTFIKSTNIKVFPCGRRRSQEVDKDLNTETLDDRYHIPFDPEARLNTEANNLKHSGLNGFTQSFIQTKEWVNDTSWLSLVIAGYLFNIKLDNAYNSPNEFGTGVLTSLETSEATCIYANILTEELQLFSGPGFREYTTFVLRNQSQTENPETCLDLLSPKITSLEAAKDLNSYYFSGLSFSTTPITDDDNTRSNKTIQKANSTLSQGLTSLCILKRDAFKDASGNTTYSAWYVNESARLPEIEHGEGPNSVKLGNVELETLNVAEITQGEQPLLRLSVDEKVDSTSGEKIEGVYQLNFFSTLKPIQENS